MKQALFVRIAHKGSRPDRLSADPATFHTPDKREEPQYGVLLLEVGPLDVTADTVL